MAVAVINTIAKSSLERGGSCGTEGIQCGNCGGMQLLALFIALSLPFHTVQDYLSRSDTAHSGLGLPRSIINQENATQTCPQVSLMEADAQLNDIFPHDLHQVDRNELAHLHSPSWLFSTQPRLPSPAPWASRPCPQSQLPPFNTCTSAPSPGSWCPIVLHGKSAHCCLCP